MFHMSQKPLRDYRPIGLGDGRKKPRTVYIRTVCMTQKIRESTQLWSPARFGVILRP